MPNQSALPAMGNHANTMSFSARNLQDLMDHMTEHAYKAGSHLFWEGESAEQLYFIKSGRVKITKSTDEGKELILHMYQQGDIFGQLVPFTQTAHSCGAKTSEDSVIGFIPRAELERLIIHSQDLAIDFMKWMALNQRITETKLRDLMMYGKPGALCSTLIRLANTYGVPGGGGTIIAKKMTHSELSDLIGATRESVNRMLNELRKLGVIDYNNDSIVVKNIDKLRTICHCENCPDEVCRL